MSDVLQKAVKDLIKVYGEEALEGVLKDLKKVGQVNYEFKEGGRFCYIDDFGDIRTDCFSNYCSNNVYRLNNYNVFPENKLKQLKYIAKKQLLERKLLAYSDLHGAQKMGWKDGDRPNYYIVAKLSDDHCGIYAGDMYGCNTLNLIYFNTREDADNAIELYKDEIKEVLIMQRQLYEGVK